MSQHIVNLTVEDAYAKLKAQLLAKGCKIVSEVPPNQLSVRQGSLWGVAPRTAKKTVNMTLEASEEKTLIKYSSKLTSDWKNITVIGCILAFILAAVCLWLATDLGAFLNTGNPSFWRWLVSARGQVAFQAGEAFVNLAWGLAVFLFIIIAAEAIVYFYCGSRVETFATEVVGELA
ncbi:MAG: hypothetical protein ACQCN4_13215 [Candidatus Bathyarchaeia archaeon]